MALNKKIEQPESEWEQRLVELMTAEPTEYTYRGKTRKLGWLHKGTYLKISEVCEKEENSWKRNVKCCSLVLMNKKSGFLSMLLTKLWYPIHWRWLYYVVDIDMDVVLGVLDASKKKVPSESYLMCTILLTEMESVMTMMNKTTKEVKAGLRAQRGGQSSL